VYFEIVVARLDVGVERVAALSARLSDAEHCRAERFRFARDRRRYVVARGRLRELLGERTGEDPRAVELVYGRNGKPALARPGLHFSVSHREELVVYAFSPGREIGVDLEAVRPLRDADDIAARFFSRHENETYRALAPRDRTLGFFNCWTRKEAFVKALGDGLSMPLDDFGVSLAPGEPPEVLQIAGVRGDGGWRLHSFAPQAGFVAAVAIPPR
jgi:4'-phosphopantetheinyl transferase